MTKIFTNKNKTLFVSKADKVEERDSYAIVLSPEFYWIKKVKLPVTKEKDALKLAASVYEGSLPAGEYAYEARKADDAFIMIAYNKKQISKELEKIVPYRSDIKEIYFAQDALSHIEECTAINAHGALSNMDGIIIQVPRSCTNTEHTLDDMLKDVNASNRKVKLSSFDNALLSTREITLITSIFGLLFLALVSEYVVYKKALSDLDTQRSEIIAAHDLPRTSIQLKSIKKSLFKKFETQKSIRERVFAISKLTLKSGEYIQRIEEGSKGTLLEIYVTDASRESAIKKLLSKSVKVKESTLSENILTLRIVS